MSSDGQFLDVSATADGWAVAGEIDANTVKFLVDAFAQLPADVRVVTVDVGAVSFVDSSGLRVLLELAERVRTNGQEMKLVRPSAAVARLVDITGLTSVFGIDAPGDRS